MKFKSFTKLSNTHQSKIITDIRALGYDKELWVVTEKLDGANFSFWYDGTDFKVASRSRFVDGTFFNCQQVIDRYQSSIVDFYQQCLVDGKLFLGDVLTITGELIGDNINSRVKYRYPEGMTRDFYAFDTSINDNQLGYMFTYDNIDCVKSVPLIDICTFDEALEYNNTFKSHLSPDIEVNFSEGLSLSPVKALFFNSGSRVWLKSKSAEFKEKGVKQHKPVVILSDEDNQRLQDILEFVNNARVLSAISKFGEVRSADFGILMKIILEDIFEDYREEYDSDASQGTTDWATIMKTIKQELSKEIREEFVKRVQNMVKLNKTLLKQQGINPETEVSLQATHTMLELLLDNPELVGIDTVSEVVRGLEFALQKLWNFPQNENFHRYQFEIKGCECPKIDNEELFRSCQPYRYYNMECPVHSAKTKKLAKEPEAKSEITEETRLSNIHKLIKDLERENEELELMKTLLKMFPKQCTSRVEQCIIHF